MLTRLRVSGFKNLVDVDVWFGPFTCIAGANGVGKSNLFDAISFLSALASRPIVDAALSIRDEGGRTGDVRSLFHHVGESFAESMSFEAEMIIPSDGLDDLGQAAKASSTLVKYALSIRLRKTDTQSLGPLELTKEELSYIKIGDSQKSLRFPNSRQWRQSAVQGRRWTRFYISTDSENGVIKVHQDGGSSGKARSLLASHLPRTALSAANAAESPTATLARSEMQSWRLLQLEPSALREPDQFSSPTKLANDGAHLPATLHRLAQSPFQNGKPSGQRLKTEHASQVYSTVANTLSELIDDVRNVYVDRDERRELLTLQVKGHDGTPHAARSLSDGTLRFLALAVLALDPETQGTLCLEEPENGIHPERIPAMIRLLQELATDTQAEIGADNPLRQVIINTHSPGVVTQIPEDSLLVAEPVQHFSNGREYQGLAFKCLRGTWRDKSGIMKAVALGRLLSYLNPSGLPNPDRLASTGVRRVIDREDLGQYRLFSENIL